MKTSDAALLTAILVVIILIVAWFTHRGGGGGGGDEAFCPGPHNINLYDHPYRYPTYEGRGASWWDGDRRCASYCQQSPCVVWCR